MLATAVCLGAGLLTVPAGAEAFAAGDQPGTTSSSSLGPARSSTGWQVTGMGDGRWAVSWTSPTRIRLGDARPVIALGDRAFPSAITRDGRSVTTTVVSPDPPHADALDVLRSGDRLDEPGYDLAGDLSDGVRSDGRSGSRQRGAPLPADPASPGPYDVVSTEYQLRPVKVRQLPRPVEMVGHVVEPALTSGPSSRPLVVFVHGWHEACYRPSSPASGSSSTWPCAGPQREVPNHLGYDYLQRRLASQGFATVSVRMNGINAQDGALEGTGSAPRSDLIQKHLQHWASMAGQHRVDLSRVVLVGHSRGGEGVDRAATEIPLSAPYRVVGQVLLAPTNFAAHAAPYIPSVTVLPSCDGDVNTLEGQRYVDSARDVLADDTALRSAVMVNGANHNYFNTEWTPGSVAPSRDDWNGEATEPCGSKHADRLSAARQRSVGLGLVGAAVRLFTGVDSGGLPLLDGSGTTTASFGDADVRSHAIGHGRDVRRPGLEAMATRATGGASAALCRGERVPSGTMMACGRDIDSGITPHWRGESDSTPTRDFVEMAWTRGGAAAGLALTRPLDLTGRRLELRTIIDPRRGPIDVRVRLGDGHGRRLELDPVGGRTVTPVWNAGPSLWWAQTVVVQPDSSPDPAGIDLNDVRTVELVAVSGDGRAWIADVSAADPRHASDVVAQRAPVASLGAASRVLEGNPAPGTHADNPTVKVPVNLSRPSNTPVRLAVHMLTITTTGERSRSTTVEVPAGQTSTSIPVPYTRDRRANLLQRSTVSIYPLHDVATGESVSRVEIVDDDPKPRFRLQTRRKVITEGQTATFRLVVDGARDYSSYADLEVRRTRAASRRHPDVSVADIAKSWVREHVGRPAGRLPLWKAEARTGVEISPSRHVIDLKVPTRKDRTKERAEWLTVTVSVGDRELTTRVQVRERRRAR